MQTQNLHELIRKDRVVRLPVLHDTPCKCKAWPRSHQNFYVTRVHNAFCCLGYFPVGYAGTYSQSQRIS